MKITLSSFLLAALVLTGCDSASPSASGVDLVTGKKGSSGNSGSSGTDVVVTPNDLAANLADVLTEPTSWFFYDDEANAIDGSVGSFTMGPATPPDGYGSAQISVSGSQRRNLATYQFGGTPLADITDLRFSTYNPSSGNGGLATRSAYLLLTADFDGSDTFQQRLEFVPRQNGTVVQDAWQEWDAIDAGAALWSWSNFFVDGMWPDGNTTRYRTWSDLLSAFPGISILESNPWVGLRVGEPYASGYTDSLDAFVFGTGAGTTTFDFEPLIGPPTSKADCKKGGWARYNNPSFPNQGQCIQFVNTGK